MPFSYLPKFSLYQSKCPIINGDGWEKQLFFGKVGENCEETRVDYGKPAEHRLFSGESVLGKSSWRFEEW